MIKERGLIMVLLIDTTHDKKGKQLALDLATRSVGNACEYINAADMNKTMMAMLYKKAIGLPEEKKTAEVKAMIETYNKKVDFIDFRRLDEIYRSCNGYLTN